MMLCSRADINECLLPSSAANAARCGDKQYCVNTEGSFSCECKLGYIEKDGACVDRNECDENKCDAKADCFNTEGSYRCDCHEGYSGTGRTCIGGYWARSDLQDIVQATLLYS